MKRILLLALPILSVPAFAAEFSADGYYHTGDGIQTAAHWPFTLELFSVAHDTKELPASKTRKAMIEMDADKRLTLRMLRDVPTEHLKMGLQDRYQLNGYSNTEKIHQFLTPLHGATVPTGSTLIISYDAKSKVTTLEAAGGLSASVEGADFMQATWKIWFGLSKPATLGDQLLSKL